MVRVLTAEWGRFGVTSNVVSPGFIEGRMVDQIPEETRKRGIKQIPARRMGSPRDVANIVALLAGEEGRYVTGQTIQVDGGLSAI